jgi:hypothetical protein
LLGLLATLAELRSQGNLPRLPLEVSILAGDVSAGARAIHESMLGRLRPSFEAEGVRMRWQHMAWDVTDPFSTTALMDEWFKFSPAAEEYLVFVSAFSGFAAKNADQVLQAVRDIAVRLHDRTFLIAWIEPMNNQSRKLLPQLWAIVAGLFRWSAKGKNAPPEEAFEYIHPFTDEVIPGRARVLPFETFRR